MFEFELSEGMKNIKNMVHWFAKTEIRSLSIEADRKHGVPEEFLMKIVKMGITGGELLGGGGGGDKPVGKPEGKKKESEMNRIAVIAMEELAWGDPAVLLNIPGPGLGGPPVMIMGTPEQKKIAFDVFKDTEKPHWGAYALTEPGFGSDVAALTTTAVKDGDYYIINGTKIFITNGARADWNVVFATVDKSLGRAGHRAFLVFKGTPGFKVGKIEDKMGLRAAETAELIFEDCRVHKDFLLGGEEYYERKVKGGGFKGAMKTFDQTRPLVAAMAVGIARAAYERLAEWVSENYMIDRPIPRYQRIKELLVDMDRRIRTARFLVWHAAWQGDVGKANTKHASMSKAFAANVAQYVTSMALDIMGRDGLERDNLIEKLYRDQKVFDIFEGTGEVQRIVVYRRLFKKLYHYA